MTLPLTFRPAAQAEFDQAALWYENQRPDLGREFVEEVQKTLDLIANSPEQFAIVERDVRECMVDRLPYCVYYRVKPSHIVVIAVFHTSRDPSIWKARS